ncbi:MAG: invasion associated locus B family protein [Hyphomonadaceae bacterium]|nr:invasion associated locus B family protein [Hyphomonadaceae bacterium]
MAATLVLGVTALIAVASAQAPPAKKPPPAADKKAATPDKQQAGAQTAWVKLCEKATAQIKDKDGKDEKKDLNICLTHHERLDGNTGMVLVSAALRQIDGQNKQHFMVMVPLGMLIQPGMRATMFPKNLWEKLQKNEKLDKAEESKLKGIQLDYTLCHVAGCTAEMEATPELLTDLKSNGGLMVFAIGASGGPVAFPVPLGGFDQALGGPPVDPQKYGEARKALMVQIAQRQQQLAAELKKQNDDLQKMQGSTAPSSLPPPAKK